MEALQNLADKLGQCSEQMKQGQNGQAAQAMQEAFSKCRRWPGSKRAENTRRSNGATGRRAAADERRRRQRQCDDGGGEGGKGDKNGKPGQGLGQGPGDGARPEAKTDGKFFDSHVPQVVGKGAARITGLTGGPNLKNQAEAEIQKAAAEIEHGNTDPLQRPAPAQEPERTRP